MNLISLPNVIEEKITSYLAANYSGSYSILKGFSLAEFRLPLILVKTGKIKEEEKGTGVYQAELAVCISTEINDVDSPVEIHDNTTQEIFVLLEDIDGIKAAFNDDSVYLYDLYLEGYDQEAGKSTDNTFQINSVFTFTVTIQS